MIYEIPHNRNEKELPIQLRLLGISHLQEPVSRPNGVPLSQWFFCKKGMGEIFVNGQRSLVSEGQGFLILPGAAHKYRAYTGSWTLDFAAFDGTLHRELLTALGMCDSGVYQLQNPGIFGDYIAALDEIRRSGKHRKQKLYSEKCYQFLLSLHEASSYLPDSQRIEENDLIKSVIVYMEGHYAEPVSLNDLSEYTGYTEEYLCLAFKKAMGQTMIQYLNRLRLSRARILLARHPDKKSAEIGRLCGFESPSYFGKVFKKEMGVTPEQFRKGG